MIAVSVYILCGILSGFFSGLLGIGGGLVIVPLLIIVFEHTQQIPPHHIMHVVVATSLSASIFTSFSSAYAQTKHKCVLWDLVRVMSPFIILGTLIGAGLANFFSADFMRWILLVFLFCVATQIFFDISPKSSAKYFSPAAYRITAFIIGAFSSFVGRAGGSNFVPFLKYTTGDMHKAIGTSSALAWSLALAGGLGYLISGYSVADLPRTNLGYIHIQALLCIAFTSMLIAPLGVKLSHALPVQILKKIFALLLYASAMRTLITVLS